MSIQCHVICGSGRQARRSGGVGYSCGRQKSEHNSCPVDDGLRKPTATACTRSMAGILCFSWSKRKERKSIYIARFWPRWYTHSAQAWITQFYLQTTPRLPFLRERSPPQQLRQRTSNCSSLLIYRPRKDERLSWPIWSFSGWALYSFQRRNCLMTLLGQCSCLLEAWMLVLSVGRNDSTTLSIVVRKTFSRSWDIGILAEVSAG